MEGIPISDFTESSPMNAPVHGHQKLALTKDEANKEADQPHPEAEAWAAGVFSDLLVHQLFSAFRSEAPAPD